MLCISLKAKLEGREDEKRETEKGREEEVKTQGFLSQKNIIQFLLPLKLKYLFLNGKRKWVPSGWNGNSIRYKMILTKIIKETERQGKAEWIGETGEGHLQLWAISVHCGPDKRRLKGQLMTLFMRKWRNSRRQTRRQHRDGGLSDTRQWKQMRGRHRPTSTSMWMLPPRWQTGVPIQQAAVRQ